MFDGGVPNGLVFVSIDASIRWLQREQARRLKVKPEDLAILFPRQAGTDLHALLGHVVAHEIGHLALRTRDHGTYGLMKAAYDDFDALSRPASFYSVDEPAALSAASSALAGRQSTTQTS